ncbi:hypothetical protein B0H16DRAFT_1499461 [Mycena metata]|uniref:Secreted protein n=1 Tax=Mycena metata TaxID=1033252 RepID=A0AAD7K6W9_9AGAR|nr:hypothetical protein B0H16DRAFT_1499461 [Mycena metata]
MVISACPSLLSMFFGLKTVFLGTVSSQLCPEVQNLLEHSNEPLPRLTSSMPLIRIHQFELTTLVPAPVHVICSNANNRIRCMPFQCSGLSLCQTFQFQCLQDIKS